MNGLKLVRKTTDYRFFETFYEGIRIELRQSESDGKVEFRFTDGFARANGYRNLTELIRECQAENEVAIGGMPEWVEYTREGIIRWEKMMFLNN